MDQQSSITAKMSAFARAYHAEHAENPVFSDDKAKELLGEEDYRALCGYVLGGADFFAPEKKGSFQSPAAALDYLVHTQLAPTPVCRAAFCERALENAVRTGTDQYVILGAGFDTFAFRKGKEFTNLSVFEVDHPLTQREKLLRIRRAEWQIPRNLSFVGCDFQKDDLEEKLLLASFSKRKKAFFSWLGVSYYLSEEEIRKTLSFLSRLSVPGSALFFDFGDEELFFAKERRVRNMIAMAKAGGEEMKSSFSLPRLEKLLQEYGFLLYDVATPKEIFERVVKPKNSDMVPFEHVNYALAVKNPLYQKD